jgi:two-component system, OmpR family, aerobic respiration control protein ArcA
MSKKLNVKDFVKNIERVAKERMLERSVVSLDHFRQLTKDDPYCILVIDDDPALRNSLKRLFEKEGYKVLLAADATELSQVLEDVPPDLILLDVGLPWVNGFELASMMKQNDDLKIIPLVFISGQINDIEKQKAHNVGASGFLEKPLDIKVVQQTVKDLLPKK